MVLNVEIYNGHIRQTKDFSLTVSELESSLAQYKYTGQNRKVDSAAENLLLPPMTLSFYNCVYESGRIPSETELIETYLNQENFFSYVPGNMVEVHMGDRSALISLDSMIARILRTYPSLVRDLHFYLMARESGLFSAVRYSVDADYKNGIDISVQYKNKWYNVALFFNTKRARFFRNKKHFRHKPLEIIDIVLTPSDAHIIGDFMLYSREHIYQLLNRIT